MSAFSDDFANAGGSSAPSFWTKHSVVGDAVTGTIVDIDDMVSETVDGKGYEAKVIITVETDDIDPETGEKQQYSHWCRVKKGATQETMSRSSDGRTRAIAAAVEEATGKRGLPEIGGTLWVKFDSTTPNKNPAFNDIKNFVAKYKAPVSAAKAAFGDEGDDPAGAPF